MAPTREDRLGCFGAGMLVALLLLGALTARDPRAGCWAASMALAFIAAMVLIAVAVRGE